MRNDDTCYGVNHQVQLDRIEAKLDQLLARKKRVPKARGSKSEYPEWFEEMWKGYPKRAGNNPKNKAFSAVKARLQEGPESSAIVHRELFHRMANGVKRYAAYCDAMGTTGTGIVMHGATFFGPADPPNYTLDWTIPKSTETLPKDMGALEQIAVERGLHPKGCAPQNIQNVYQYRQWIEERMK